jgi:hypothetical protein
LGLNKTRIFLQEGLDDPNQIELLQEIAVYAQRFLQSRRVAKAPFAVPTIHRVGDPKWRAGLRLRLLSRSGCVRFAHPADYADIRPPWSHAENCLGFASGHRGRD